MKTGICPGSFDPVSLGHIDIIRRAAMIFDKVIVVVMVNAKKRALFTLEERVDMLTRSTRSMENVSVLYSEELLANFAEKLGNCVVVKGLRAISDFESEFQMALLNRKLNRELETIFLPTAEEYLYLSSSAIREIGSLDGDISAFVPQEILTDVEKKLRRGATNGKQH